MNLTYARLTRRVSASGNASDDRSTLYLTTLSFDGIMLSWLKTERAFSDIFISVMRGFCVVTSLGGTAIMPVLSRNLGLSRAGAWSIWYVPM